METLLSTEEYNKKVLSYMVEQIKMGNLKLINPAERVRDGENILEKNKAYFARKAEQAIKANKKYSPLLAQNRRNKLVYQS